jgi:hypothetical protein
MRFKSCKVKLGVIDPKRKKREFFIGDLIIAGNVTAPI